MGRLTFKNKNGTWGLNNFDIKDVPRGLYGAICKLKDYAETGMSPQEVENLKEKCEKDRWIPITEKFPENDTYILLSYDDFTLPDIGRYEEDEQGGAFFPGDDDTSCISYGLIVNAWKPLPEKYKEDIYE